MYLIRENKHTAAHHWDGSDTACRMWSTGGIGHTRKWKVRADPGKHPICNMCAIVKARAAKKAAGPESARAESLEAALA